MEQGNAIQLSVVLFLPAYNRCANGCTAADEQQGNPQCKVACIAGLDVYKRQMKYNPASQLIILNNPETLFQLHIFQMTHFPFQLFGLLQAFQKERQISALQYNHHHTIQ